MPVHEVQDLLRNRILILDGAMGTMIQRYKLDEAAFRGERFKHWTKDLKGHNDLLNVTQPSVIEAIHRQYLEAGADIVETNTFNSQSVSLTDYGMDDLGCELSKAGAECAKRAVAQVVAAQPARRCFVAGAIGPTTKTSSVSTDSNDAAARGTTYSELVRAYGEQVRGLLDGGVDLLLVRRFSIRSTPRPHFSRSSGCLRKGRGRCRSWPRSPSFRPGATAGFRVRRSKGSGIPSRTCRCSAWA